uniref:XisH protein n=1 Tax=Cyanothece sp. (strain PCC 7425 / ATCC 29141) TaxID=395961 RepID=B8HTF3_CYAP4
MPAKDIYHEAVKTALILDGWIITADPYRITYEDAELYADLAAERSFSAERSGQKIVVEVKSFTGRSLLHDFHAALGQYIIYRQLLQLTAPQYNLYLAIDDITFSNFFQRKSVQTIAKANKLLLLIVDVEKEIIVQWKN